MAQGHCVDNSKIGIPKRALPTSHVTAQSMSQLKFWIQRQTKKPRTALAPIVLPIQKSNIHISKADLQAILGKIKPPSSTISPIPSPAYIFTEQAHNDTTKAMISNVWPTAKITTPKMNDDLMIELAEFEDLVQQGNHAKKIPSTKSGINKLVHQLDITCA